MLLGIYLGSLALGGILIAASVLLGGHDAGGDHDADASADADADASTDADASAEAGADNAGADDAAEVGPGTALIQAAGHELVQAGGHPLLGGWLPFLSLRFWTFGLASFGATGALLGLTVLPGLASLAIAAPAGFCIGTGVTWVFRYLKKSSVGAISSIESLQGREARVLLPIRPGALGKIRIVVDGPDVDMLARTREPEIIPIDTTVLVITVEGGVAEVIPLPRSGSKPS